MKLDIRQLLAGQNLVEFNYELPIDTENEDVQSVLWGTRFPSPMKVWGEITNTAGYMRLKLDATVDYIAYCARCLDPVEGRFALSLEKTVATRDLLGTLTDDKIDDFVLIEDGFINVDEQALMQLEMEFPSRFLCKDDCKGLCQKCGKNLNTAKCECEEKEIDPRLLPLKEILERMKNENK